LHATNQGVNQSILKNIMHPFSTRLLKITNLLLGGLLALIGFAASCDKDNILCEYGMPHAKFKVNGKVISVATNEPVANIRVVMQYDTAYTTSDGSYEVSDDFGFPRDTTYPLKFEDVDGVYNGSFHPADTSVEFKEVIFHDGDGKWYAGETEKEFNISLDPEE